MHNTTNTSETAMTVKRVFNYYYNTSRGIRRTGRRETGSMINNNIYLLYITTRNFFFFF